MSCNRSTSVRIPLRSAEDISVYLGSWLLQKLHATDLLAGRLRSRRQSTSPLFLIGNNQHFDNSAWLQTIYPSSLEVGCIQANSDVKSQAKMTSVENRDLNMPFPQAVAVSRHQLILRGFSTPPKYVGVAGHLELLTHTCNLVKPCRLY